MPIHRTLIAMLLLAGPALAKTVDLPPIDKPLPFGTDALGLPQPDRVNTTVPRTAQLLAAELKRPGQTRERRAELVSDLGATELPAALPAIIEAASDPDAIVRAAAAAALGTFKSPESAAALVRLATDADPTVRDNAVRSAAAVGSGDLVTAGLNDADRTVAAAALAVASADQAAGIAGQLSSEDPMLRAAAATALARAGVTAQADAIARLLADDSVLVQSSAIEALGTLKATPHAQGVVDLLKHDHPTVRRYAVAALPNLLSADAARTRGIAMLSDPDESVRTAAAIALAKVPGPAAIEPLVKQLDDPYTPLHTAAREALVAIGQPASAAAMALLDHANPRRREDGSYVLGQLASHEGFERHVKLLEDADWVLVAQVARSLGQIGDAAAGPALVTAIQRATADQIATEQKPTAHAAATNAIVAGTLLGHEPTSAAVSKLIPQKSYSSSTRAAAIWSVGVLGAPNVDAIFGRFGGIVGDLEESSDVQMEAIKAVGNRKHEKTKGILSAAAVQMSGDMAAAAHWSSDRLRGQVTPFEMPASTWQADVSVSDFTR
ncbi:MAG TPA: HEAT repeat domain-containing protein [Tepidisphaeraceae bacterium]|jgi:HEAT repeat protein|nr:HEAT repeat domain-containing protein [Tepidisphaeraceae bacterium]